MSSGGADARCFFRSEKKRGTGMASSGGAEGSCKPRVVLRSLHT